MMTNDEWSLIHRSFLFASVLHFDRTGASGDDKLGFARLQFQVKSVLRTL
jgi:hypothetical protein